MLRTRLIGILLLSNLVACGEDNGSTDTPKTKAYLDDIQLTPDNGSLAKGMTISFKASGIMTDESVEEITAEVFWSSTNESVATLSDSGEATGVSLGTTTILATSGVVTGSTLLTVTEAGLLSIAVTPREETIEAGDTIVFSATGTFSDNTTEEVTDIVSWISSVPAIATVSRGTAIGIATGTTTISAEDATGTINSDDSAGSATLSVFRGNPTSIEVSPTNVAVPLGSVQPFQATARWDDGYTEDVTTRATWSAVNPAVADIDSSGVAETLTEGSTSITATYYSVNAAATLTVTPAELARLSVSPNQASLGMGATLDFTATGRFTDQTELEMTNVVDWASSDTGVATVSSGPTFGRATALSVGVTTISVTDPATGLTSDTDSSALTVTPPVLVSIAITPDTVTITRSNTQSFAATGTYSDSSTQPLTNLTWASSDLLVSTVDASGLATGVEVGVATISATDPASGISSDDASASATLTVDPPPLVAIELRPAIAALLVGNSQQLAAWGTYDDSTQSAITQSVVWASSHPSVSVTSAGMATGQSVGSAVISATEPSSNISSDDTNQSATISVTTAVLVSIAVTPGTASVPRAGTATFLATGTYDDSSTAVITDTVVWSSDNQNVATVGNTSATRGIATGLTAGLANISASDPGSNISSDDSNQSAALTVSSVGVADIAVFPSSPTINLGATQQFSAQGTFTDSSVHDVTESVTWSASGSAATISNTDGTRGLATGNAIGVAAISATFGGVSSDDTSQSAQLTVANLFLFADNFEDADFSDWTVLAGSYTRTIDPTTAASKTMRSLRMAGGSSQHRNGVSHNFTASQPTYISIWVRSNSTSTSDGYVVIGDSQNMGQGIVHCHFGNGTIYCDNGTRRGETPYQANRWYHLEIRNLNWGSRVFDIYIDNYLAEANVAFRGSATTMDVIHLYNYTAGATAWWDEILIR